MEIRGGAISKGNGEGDSLRGLLQEFLLEFVFTLCLLLQEVDKAKVDISGFAVESRVKLVDSSLNREAGQGMALLGGCKIHICQISLSII